MRGSLGASISYSLRDLGQVTEFLHLFILNISLEDSSKFNVVKDMIIAKSSAINIHKDGSSKEGRQRTGILKEDYLIKRGFKRDCQG